MRATFAIARRNFKEELKKYLYIASYLAFSFPFFQ